MLTLLTGLPGSGKTLYLIKHIIGLDKTVDYKHSDGTVEVIQRQVFYYRIPDLDDSLGWKKIEDPYRWFDLPVGAIILMDEAQKIFPVRHQAKAPPLHVAEFEEHRHRGHDVYLLTQFPALLDYGVREFTGRHLHLKRVFGFERSSVFEWQELGNPKNHFSKKEATTSTFTFPKEVYKLYKSSDLHTVKKKFPKKILLIPVLIIFTLLLIFATFYNIRNNFQGGSDSPSGSSPSSSSSSSSSSVASGLGGLLGSGDDGELVGSELWTSDAHTERLAGVAYTKPFYDSTLQVNSFPKISGCMLVEFSRYAECKCNTQQGTTLQMPASACRFYVKNGWFDFSISDEDYEDRQQRIIDRYDDMFVASASALSPSSADSSQ